MAPEVKHKASPGFHQATSSSGLKQLYIWPIPGSHGVSMGLAHGSLHEGLIFMVNVGNNYHTWILDDLGF